MSQFLIRNLNLSLSLFPSLSPSHYTPCRAVFHHLFSVSLKNPDKYNKIRCDWHTIRDISAPFIKLQRQNSYSLIYLLLNNIMVSQFISIPELHILGECPSHTVTVLSSKLRLPWWYVTSCVYCVSIWTESSLNVDIDLTHCHI